MFKRFQWILILKVLLLALLVSCNGTIEEEEKLKVMATTPLLEDWVNNVAKGRVSVESIIPYGTDPHSYQPGAKDVSRIVSANTIFSVGLGYEEKWLKELLENNSDLANTSLGESVSPIKMSGGHDGHGHGHDHGDSGLDPHFWFDPTRVAMAVDAIANHLSEIDPMSQDYYQSNASEYKAQLMDLNNQIKDEVSAIPEQNRVIITGHDSLGYLEGRYGIESLQPIVSSVTSETGLSPDDLIKAVKFIKKHNVKVIFLETTQSDKYAKTVANETGINVASGLNVETLDDANGNYIDFMKDNIGVIVSNLSYAGHGTEHDVPHEAPHDDHEEHDEHEGHDDHEGHEEHDEQES